MSRRSVYKLSVLSSVAAIIVIGLFVKCRSVEEKGLIEMEGGVLATVNGERITRDEFEKEFSSLTEDKKQEFENDREGLLEAMIKQKVLLQEALKRGIDKRQEVAEAIGLNPSQKSTLLIEALKTEVTKDVTVKEEDIKKFYEENRAQYEGQEGGSYEEMHDAIADYLKANLVFERFEKFTDELLVKAVVQKNKKWVLEERSRKPDPIEEAKKKRLPIIADFGAGKCIPCIKMMPILEELKKELARRAVVLLIDVNEESACARRQKISSIPTQIFFDAKGNEVFRHIGFFPKEEILKKLEEIESGRLVPNSEKGSEGGLLQKAENMLKEGSWLAVLLVFFLGILTASNPCVLATIPLVIGYIGGFKEASGFRKSFLFSLFFVLGLAVMFTTLGVIAAFTGSMVGDVGSFWAYLVAGVCIIMGLHLLNVLEFNIPVMQGLKPKSRGVLGSFLFGLLFGIISTPCAIPIVAVLMVLIAAKGSVVYGAVMLLVYSLGHSVLILVAGTSIGAAKGLIESKGLTRVTNSLRRVAAALIIGVGFWFLFR